MYGRVCVCVRMFTGVQSTWVSGKKNEWTQVTCFIII